MTGIEISRRMWNSHWRTALFAGLGAAGGIVYYQLVGCQSGGTCAITSSAWRTAAFFAVAAAVAGFPSSRAPEAGTDEPRPR